jgi:ParB family chromosome partitioning protein
MADRKPERRGLGRGLSALMADVAPAEETRARRPDLTVPIERIEPNPNQPRRDFDRGALEELAASIREKGVIQPLIVRESHVKSGYYEIVAGERRWRAAQMAQLHDLPVLVREVSDSELLELAIIENIQRADLNAIEEAMGYRQLMDRFGHTQERLAEALSKSRSHIANLLRLLTLPDIVQTWLREGRLTAGHARALVATDNPAELARRVIDQGLSVRETERLAQAPKRAKGKERPPRTREKDADTRVLEQDLSANLRMKVVIDHRGHDGGHLIITYKTLEQLDELCQILSQVR